MAGQKKLYTTTRSTVVQGAATDSALPPEIRTETERPTEQPTGQST